MKYIFLFSLFVSLSIHGQTKTNCSILDGKIDTIVCSEENMIVELYFCQSNGLYHNGLVTDINGKEKFCFDYSYDKNNNLKNITFWTFEWQKSGYVTKDKIGVLKTSGGKQKLIVKKGFTLTEDLAKLVTKTK